MRHKEDTLSYNIGTFRSYFIHVNYTMCYIIRHNLISKGKGNKIKLRAIIVLLNEHNVNTVKMVYVDHRIYIIILGSVVKYAI